MNQVTEKQQEVLDFLVEQGGATSWSNLDAHYGGRWSAGVIHRLQKASYLLVAAGTCKSLRVHENLLVRTYAQNHQSRNIVALCNPALLRKAKIDTFINKL